MTVSANVEAAVAAFRAATSGTDDGRAAALALLSAARACDLMLGDEMPAASLSRFLGLLDAACGLLIEHGGPIDLTPAAGSA